MIVYERYAGLIGHISTCNGDGRSELDSKVAEGVITKDDAELVWFYACCKKVMERVKDIVSEKPRPY